MLTKHIRPLKSSTVLNTINLQENQWGNILDFYDGYNDLNDYDLAIVGIDHPHCAAAAVRQQLYVLYNRQPNIRIIDMGNIKTSSDKQTAYFNLAKTLEILLSKNVCSLIIGGTHDYTYAQYLAYQSHKKLVNVLNIDERIDMLHPSNNQIDEASFLIPIFTHQPNYLFNYSHIGYQSCFLDRLVQQQLDAMNFDYYRLGEFKDKIDAIEPLVRHADIASIDLAAMAYSSASGHMQASPNGFSALEACQIARYIGFAPYVSTFGLYGLHPPADAQSQTAMLCAQMIWYFVEAFYERKKEIPKTNDSAFLKYIVHIEAAPQEAITFFKSTYSERWWMDLPYGNKDKFGRDQLIPCSYTDYQTACKGELPDRWMKTFKKLTS